MSATATDEGVNVAELVGQLAIPPTMTTTKNSRAAAAISAARAPVRATGMLAAAEPVVMLADYISISTAIQYISGIGIPSHGHGPSSSTRFTPEYTLRSIPPTSLSPYTFSNQRIGEGFDSGEQHGCLRLRVAAARADSPGSRVEISAARGRSSDSLHGVLRRDAASGSVRWANLGWTAGAGFSILAASVMIPGLDRPARPPGRHPIQGRADRLRVVLPVAFVAIASTLGVAVDGLITDRAGVTIVGLATSITIAVTMGVRARDSIRMAERSSELLDSALAESERARDELRLANEKLQRTNASLRTLHIAVAQGFNLIDERTQGRLRGLVEEAGDDLAALVAETVDDEVGS